MAWMMAASSGGQQDARHAWYEANACYFNQEHMASTKVRMMVRRFRIPCCHRHDSFDDEEDDDKALRILRMMMMMVMTMVVMNMELVTPLVTLMTTVALMMMLMMMMMVMMRSM